MLTFEASETQNVTVSVIDDDLIEGNESFMIALTSVDALVVVGTPIQTTVTIQDNSSE